MNVGCLQEGNDPNLRHDTAGPLVRIPYEVKHGSTLRDGSDESDYIRRDRVPRREILLLQPALRCDNVDAAAYALVFSNVQHSSCRFGLDLKGQEREKIVFRRLDVRLSSSVVDRRHFSPCPV